MNSRWINDFNPDPWYGSNIIYINYNRDKCIIWSIEDKIENNKNNYVNKIIPTNITKIIDLKFIISGIYNGEFIDGKHIKKKNNNYNVVR